MINKLSNFKALLLLVILLLIAGWFYWFQFRPSEIRKGCSTQSKDKLNVEIGKGIFERGRFGRDSSDPKDLDNYYDLAFKICIEEKGLK